MASCSSPARPRLPHFPEHFPPLFRSSLSTPWSGSARLSATATTRRRHVATTRRRHVVQAFTTAYASSLIAWPTDGAAARMPKAVHCAQPVMQPSKLTSPRGPPHSVSTPERRSDPEFLSNRASSTEINRLEILDLRIQVTRNRRRSNAQEKHPPPSRCVRVWSPNKVDRMAPASSLEWVAKVRA